MFVGCETSGEGGRHPAIIPDMIHLGGKWRQQIFGCDTSGWNGGDSRIPDVIHPGGKWRQLDGMAAAAA